MTQPTIRIDQYDVVHPAIGRGVFYASPGRDRAKFERSFREHLAWYSTSQAASVEVVIQPEADAEMPVVAEQLIDNVRRFFASNASSTISSITLMPGNNLFLRNLLIERTAVH